MRRNPSVVNNLLPSPNALVSPEEHAVREEVRARRHGRLAHESTLLARFLLFRDQVAASFSERQTGS